MNSHPNPVETHSISRRRFVHGCAAGAAALASTSILGCHGNGRASSGQSVQSGPASRTILFNSGWSQPIEVVDASSNAGPFKPAVTIPNSVVTLSWKDWDPKVWEKVWMYGKQFSLPPEFKGLRVFLHFDGVMVGTTPKLNGHEYAKHLGGYLPCRYELTDHLKDGDNVLSVEVDSRWSNVPPEGAPIGPRRVDYLEVGGIYRDVRLHAVPTIYIRDVFAKPVKVLDSDRHIEVICTIDAGAAPQKPLRVRSELMRDGKVITRAEQNVSIDKPGDSEVKLTLSNLGNVALWHVDSPNLYHVVTTLLVDGKPVHDYTTRIGLRDARFELEGFFLNGKRLQIFGLNRHEVFPYVGYAMPARVMRRDAHILRHDFNCNMVRCSHYPQHEAFLDACDELGLMVWEEVPGWGYLGDDAWKELLVRDVHDMIIRDRNHPSIIIWGTRANESANDAPLYTRTKALAKSLDDSRPSSGSMTSGTRRNYKNGWDEDVFAFDDYHANPDGTVGITGPADDIPYMLSEAVGQFDYTKRKGFGIRYRRNGDIALLQLQAIRHAQAHSAAAKNKRICGVVAWCAFEYASLVNATDTIKTPGVSDVFRIPKLGATFYLAQTQGNARPRIEPSFYWDFGPKTPRGPGKEAAIFSNCDRLEVLIDGKPHATLHPDKERYPHLRHAPFFVDLDLDGTGHPELRIDGYIKDKRALSRSFSSDPLKDQFYFAADDQELFANESDATRLVFKVVDQFGADRALGTGEVQFEVTGPGELVGDNPFDLAPAGGAAAVWIKALPGNGGTITVRATHSALGSKSLNINAWALTA